MAFSLQIKYASNAFRKGDCVAIRPEGFEYSEGDCISEWIKAGRDLSDWKYHFVILHITNQDMYGTEEEVSILSEEYLTFQQISDQVALGNDVNEFVEEHNPEGLKRRYHITLPSDYNHPVRKQLREGGYAEAEWDVIKPYIEEYT